MKNLFLLVGILLISASVVSAQDKFSTYSNDRFYFSIEYPTALLKMQPPPENDDGRIFISADSAIEMRVWGQYNAEDRTLEERYERDLKGYTEKPAYMILKRDWYILSGIKDGKIFYQKTMIRRKNGDVFFTFTIGYPLSERSKLDTIVKRISESFKFDPNPDA